MEQLKITVVYQLMKESLLEVVKFDTVYAYRVKGWGWLIIFYNYGPAGSLFVRGKSKEQNQFGLA